MKLSELLSGRPDFASKSQVIEFVANSKNFDPQREDLRKADALLIFSTSNQHTWLVATSERLYCILDDIRKDEPHINWSKPKRSLVNDGRFVAKVKVEDKTARTGTIDIGDAGRPWLFTKRLFSLEPVEGQIRALVSKAML